MLLAGSSAVVRAEVGSIRSPLEKEVGTEYQFSLPLNSRCLLFYSVFLCDNSAQKVLLLLVSIAAR